MDEEDYAPLFDAIEEGDLAAVESFLQTPGVNVDSILEEIEDEYDELVATTPLNWAIHHNHKTIVEVLLAHGASGNGRVGADNTPLQEACLSPARRSDVVSLLLEHGPDMNAMTAFYRMTPLTMVCDADTNLDIAQLLLTAGADMNGGGGWIAPLHRAIYYENKAAFDLLLKSGADVNTVANNVYLDFPAGSTPLHFASYRSNFGFISTLLEAGAIPNIADSEGQTPLYDAALWSSVDVVTALLDAGADPLHRDNDGSTPLQCLYEIRCRNISAAQLHGDRHPSISLIFRARRNPNFSADHSHIITALVAAGDRSWEFVPTPCPGLEAAMLSVWQNAPDELPELVKHMENPPQTLIELYARMDDEEMKRVVQEVLRVLHRHVFGFPHLKEQLLNFIFGLASI